MAGNSRMKFRKNSRNAVAALSDQTPDNSLFGMAGTLLPFQRPSRIALPSVRDLVLPKIVSSGLGPFNGPTGAPHEKPRHCS